MSDRFYLGLVVALGVFTMIFLLAPWLRSFDLKRKRNKLEVWYEAGPKLESKLANKSGISCTFCGGRSVKKTLVGSYPRKDLLRKVEYQEVDEARFFEYRCAKCGSLIFKERVDLLDPLPVTSTDNKGTDFEQAKNWFMSGLRAMEKQSYEQAESAFQKSLELVSDRSSTLANLGAALIKLKKFEKALQAALKAVEIDQKNHEGWLNCGLASASLGKHNEAVDFYQKAVQTNPNYPEAFHNLGVSLQELGRSHEALACFDVAIRLKPKFTDAFNSRGYVLQELNQLNEALESYDEAIALKPEYAEALNNRGATLRSLRRFDEALASYDKAIAIKPGYAEALNNRAIALIDLKRFDEALEYFNKAIELKPDYAEAYYNLGNIFQDFKLINDALQNYDKAIALRPDYAEAYYNRGLVQQSDGRIDDALESYKEAIALKSDFPEAFNNQGVAQQNLHRMDEALASYDKATALNPDYAEAFWNKSLLLLLKGDYLLGWRLYEWRLQKDNGKEDYYNFPDNLAWRGQSNLQGKTLLVHGEQGFGDVLQFCRYLPQLQALGAKLLFEVPKPLVSLISTLQCDMTVLAKGSALPQFDAYCPVMSLPMVFKTTLQNIPAQTPYLFVEPEKRSNWQQRLGVKKQPRVGLVWSGSDKHKNDISRSIQLRSLLPFVDTSIEWHSLQKEYRQNDLVLLAQYPQIAQHQEELQDFSDTAALIECLDLVITVDTSVAHLAGAMGKPVWILLPYSPDYRWLLDRADSPWYPSAKLYRQDTSRSWEPVLGRVASKLRSWTIQSL